MNLSGTPHTERQQALLAHGPNFAMTPRNSLYRRYIKAIELVCMSLKTTEAEELRGKIIRVLTHAHTPKPNLSKGKWKTLRQLELIRGCIILIADEEMALILMDRKKYIKKAKILLDDSNTHRLIPTYPTNKQKLG